MSTPRSEALHMADVYKVYVVSQGEALRLVMESTVPRKVFHKVAHLQAQGFQVWLYLPFYEEWWGQQGEYGGWPLAEPPYSLVD